MSLTPNQKKAARYLIRRYCERSVAARPGIHYSQARPMTHLGVPPEKGFTADCSGFATSAFFWADKYTQKFKVEDPNGLGYNGTGYTGTLLANNRKRRVPLEHKMFVGDMALYGPSLGYTTHVCICMKSGSADSSEWASHGSEAGPYVVRLKYRSDLLCVVRGKSLV
jgi:hypothetical protein